MGNYRYRWVVAWLLFCGLIFGALPAAWADTLRAAKISVLSGDVQVMKAGGEKSMKAFKGMSLTQGDTVITGKSATATLELDQNRDIRIAENSKVLLSELVAAVKGEKTTLQLLAGGIWGSIREQLNADSHLRVKTANAIMGVRGTQFFVGQRDGTTDVAVLEGTVVASSYRPVEQPGGGGAPPPPLETVLSPGQQLILDMPPVDPSDFVVAPISVQTLDLFVLEQIQQQPGLLDGQLLPGLDQVIEQRQEEQRQQQQQQEQQQQGQQQPRRLIYDEQVIEETEEEEEPIIPRQHHLPMATDVTLTGQPYIADQLEVGYCFQDLDGDAEQGTTYRWSSSTSAEGSWSIITGATERSYTPSNADEGLYLICEVTPADQFSTGATVRSNALGPVLSTGFWQTSGTGLGFAATYSDLQLRSGSESLYVAYLDGANRAQVHRLDGNTWTSLGVASPGFSYNLVLRVDGDTPYVAYENQTPDHGIFVKRYVNGAWEGVGVGPVLAVSGATSDLDLAVKDGVVYVAVANPVPISGGGYAQYPRAFCLNGAGGWDSFGVIGPGEASGVAITLDDAGTPYVAYRREPAEYDPIYLFSHNGAAWVALASYDSHGKDPAENFSLEWTNGQLHLLTTYFSADGPAWLRYEAGMGFVAEQEIGFAEGRVTYPASSSAAGYTFVAYQNEDSRLAVQSATGEGEWTHFGGLGIIGGAMPSLALYSERIYLGYRDASGQVHVVSSSLSAPETNRLAQPSAPVWSEAEPAVLSWIGVAEAEGYRLRLIKDGLVVKSLTVNDQLGSYDFSSLLRLYGSGAYGVTIKAVGDGLVSQDSLYSESSDQLVAPLLLDTVSELAWEGTVLHWSAVDHAAAYRLSLLSQQVVDENDSYPPLTLMEVDISANLTSYDVGQIILLADQRLGGAYGYQATVTALGEGIYADANVSTPTTSLSRMAAPPVADIFAEDEGDAGNASDIRVSLTLPIEVTGVSSYRVILQRAEEPTLKLVDLNLVPPTSYHAVDSTLTSPFSLIADLLDSSGNVVVEGLQYRIYVLSVADGALTEVNSYAVMDDGMVINSAALRLTGVADLGDVIRLTFNNPLAASLSLSAGDIQVASVINGVTDTVLIQSVTYDSNLVFLHLTDYLSVPWDGSSYGYYQVTIPSAALTRFQSTAEATLTGVLTWQTAVTDRYIPSFANVVVNSQHNQVQVTVGDTPVGDRPQLRRIEGEVATHLLQEVNFWGKEFPILGAYYDINGVITFNLASARTSSYDTLQIDLSEFHDGSGEYARDLYLVIEDVGDSWSARTEQIEAV